MPVSTRSKTKKASIEKRPSHSPSKKRRSSPVKKRSKSVSPTRKLPRQPRAKAASPNTKRKRSLSPDQYVPKKTKFSKNMIRPMIQFPVPALLKSLKEEAPWVPPKLQELQACSSRMKNKLNWRNWNEVANVMEAHFSNTHQYVEIKSSLKEFHESFNPRVFDKLSDDAWFNLSTFFTAYTDCKPDTRLQLVLNYFYKFSMDSSTNNSTNSIEKLLGPISLSYHVSPDKQKKVYIFGDRHVQKSECNERDQDTIHLANYLSRWLAESDVFIDLFLETHYDEKTHSKKKQGREKKPNKKSVEQQRYVMSTKNPDKMSYMKHIIRKFQFCWIRDKRSRTDQCYFQTNSRVHSADTTARRRILFKKDGNLESSKLSYEKFSKEFKIFEEVYNSTMNVNDMKSLQRTFSPELLKQIEQQFEFEFSEMGGIPFTLDEYFDTKHKIRFKIEKYMEFFQQHKYEAELGRLKTNYSQAITWPRFEEVLDKYLHHFTEQTLPEEAEEYRSFDQRMIKKWEEQHGVRFTQQHQKFMKRIIYLNQLMNISIISTVPLMDMYLLGRLFKKYDISADENMPENANHAIIYAGDAHCANYRKFLTMLGFTQQFSTLENPRQCIQINPEQMRFPE